MKALLVAAAVAVSFTGIAAADGPEPPGLPRCEIWWEDTVLTHNIEPLPQPQHPSSVWCDY